MCVYILYSRIKLIIFHLYSFTFSLRKKSRNKSVSFFKKNKICFYLYILNYKSKNKIINYKITKKMLNLTNNAYVL